MIVVDTNVLAYNVLPGPQSVAARAVASRDPAWVAPRIWRMEFRNVLATVMRTRAVSLGEALTAFTDAEAMVRDTGELVTTEHCLEVAARAGISACDAEFVATAEALGVRLVTADRRLVRACPERAISLERFVAGD